MVIVSSFYILSGLSSMLSEFDKKGDTVDWGEPSAHYTAMDCLWKVWKTNENEYN